MKQHFMNINKPTLRVRDFNQVFSHLEIRLYNIVIM